MTSLITPYLSMGLTSLQVCMDSSDWLQGTINEENGMDSSSPSGDMLTCSRPLMERRLRPPHDQMLKCPRCDSTHTKFCYYNNYSLSQPRYFCKTCRRYWTKGGTLRNIPVGGGCRKNKKVSSKKPNDQPISLMNTNMGGSSSGSLSHNPTQLQLSNYPDPAHFAHLNNYMDMRYNANIPIDFMESKFDFIANTGGDLGMIGGLANLSNSHGYNGANNNLCTSFGVPIEGYNGNFNFPYEGNNVDHCGIDVKPNRLLSLEWQDQGCNSDHNSIAKETNNFGYIGNGLGSWSGLMNGYGSSAANPLV